MGLFLFFTGLAAGSGDISLFAFFLFLWYITRGKKL